MLLQISIVLPILHLNNDFLYLAYKNNNVIASISKEGNLSIFNYDENHNLLSLTKEDGTYIDNTYDSNNNLLSSILHNEEEVISKSQLYNNNLLVSSINEYNDLTSYSYDLSNRVSDKVIDNQKESYSYNNKDDLIESIVELKIVEKNSISSGSGFIISPDGVGNKSNTPITSSPTISKL